MSAILPNKQITPKEYYFLNYNMIYRVINMKKFSEIIFLGLKALTIISLLIFCITETSDVKTAVSDAVMRCLNVVIPSLYGMMIVSGFLIKSGIIDKLPRILTLPGKIVFGMESSVFTIFIISLFAGYPVGAKMLCARSESGIIKRRDAELLLGVCFGAGPAFIFGCISSRLYGNSCAGRLILISTIGADVLLALIISFFIGRNSAKPQNSAKLRFSADALTESVLSAGRSMADICIMITAFSVFTSFLSGTGILETAAVRISQFLGISSENCIGLLYAFLDVTAVDKLRPNNYELLPVLSSLTAFGGVCVIMQIAALTAGKLSVRPLIVMRSAAALISGLICRLLMPAVLSQASVSAAEFRFSMHRSTSPVPSVLIIIMTFLLFEEYEKLRSKKHCNK